MSNRTTRRGLQGRRRRNDWAALLTPARQNPGQSFVLEGFADPERLHDPNYVNSVANNIRTGRYAGIEPGEFRVVVDGPCIYVQHIGNKES